MMYLMKNRLKKLSMLQGRKRYVVLGLLAIELLSLPAAAQIVQRVSFEVRPRVVAVEIPTSEPGMSRYLVSSNAGFGVKAYDVVGDINVAVHMSGAMSGTTRFGDSAQLPGPKSGCAQASGLGSHVYLADRKTAATPGTPPEQAVVFEFKYEPDARPKFDFIAGVDSTLTVATCFDAAT